MKFVLSDCPKIRTICNRYRF